MTVAFPPSRSVLTLRPVTPQRFMFAHILFVLACVSVPIVWGILVNRMFGSLRRRNGAKSEENEPMIEYYI